MGSDRGFLFVVCFSVLSLTSLNADAKSYAIEEWFKHHDDSPMCDCTYVVNENYSPDLTIIFHELSNIVYCSCCFYAPLYPGAMGRNIVECKMLIRLGHAETVLLLLLKSLPTIIDITATPGGFRTTKQS